MKKLLWPVLTLLLLLTSCSATMRVVGTSPAFERGLTCNPSAFALSGNFMLHFSWTGPSSGEDSLSTTPGSPFSFSKQVPSGTYQIRAWGSNLAGAGCDTLISRSFSNTPSTPVIQP